METFDERLAERVDAYVESLFVPPDETLAQGLRDAAAASLPPINVSANEAKLLYLIAKLSNARRMLEIGTLGGYSTTWLARALPPDGELITLELESRHAEVARRNLDRSGVGARVEIRVGPAADSLRSLIETRAAPFDLIFIDADKEAYAEYLELSLRLARVGTCILADNVIRNGRVLADHPDDTSARGAKAFNQAIAAHPRLDSIILPIIRTSLDGLSISIVTSER
jgi:predicted O-methyltransferase YrrM